MIGLKYSTDEMIARISKAKRPTAAIHSLVIQRMSKPAYLKADSDDVQSGSLMGHIARKGQLGVLEAYRNLIVDWPGKQRMEECRQHWRLSCWVHWKQKIAGSIWRRKNWEGFCCYKFWFMNNFYFWGGSHWDSTVILSQHSQCQ